MHSFVSRTKKRPDCIVLGPIIGKVTDKTARVAIEFENKFDHFGNKFDQFGNKFDQSGNKFDQFGNKLDQMIKECILISKTDDMNQHSQIEIANKGFPTIFRFFELTPNTLYKVVCDGAEIGQFKTLRSENDNPGNLKVGIVSCNDFTKKDKTLKKDLWFDLTDNIEDLDYVFHIGDQCYMDMGAESANSTPYQKCKAILASIDEQSWPKKRTELLEVLRSRYRQTWNQEDTAYVLANVPNLMILDDHEIKDDWGWGKPDNFDSFYGQLAREVYYEYQRQLREDIDWKKLNNLKSEYHAHILNGVGVVFVDYRGSRSWFRETGIEDNQLGNAQKQWITNLFSEQGQFSNLNSVLFISPFPLVFLSHFLTNLASKYIDDAKEHWAFKNNKELENLFEILRKWKLRREGGEVTLIGGDVHVGGHTEIFDKEDRLFKQFTTSAINNTVPKKHESKVIDILQKASGNFEKEYFYNHIDWIRYNNYGLLEVKNVNGESLVTCQLVYGHSTGIKIQEPHDNRTWLTKPKECNIF